MQLLLVLNFVLLLIIILLLLFKRETKTLLSKQDEIKEKIIVISKELSENFLNTRHMLNQEITNILKNTEMLILDQVNKTISTLGTTDINLQQRMENLRTQLHQTLTDTVKNLTNSINSNTTQLTLNLNTKLEQLNKRFADTTGLITNLNLKIGELSKSAEELRKLNE
ncbi:MAG: hypothetical protein NC917_04275, partial [Candidatus Omnitrophica bacterium]|nr:hypothetical protein [Candidatus Omnitrophota bacterium]